MQEHEEFFGRSSREEKFSASGFYGQRGVYFRKRLQRVPEFSLWKIEFSALRAPPSMNFVIIKQWT